MYVCTYIRMHACMYVCILTSKTKGTVRNIIINFVVGKALIEITLIRYITVNWLLAHNLETNIIR